MRVTGAFRLQIADRDHDFGRSRQFNREKKECRNNQNSRSQPHQRNGKSIPLACSAS